MSGLKALQHGTNISSNIAPSFSRLLDCRIKSCTGESTARGLCAAHLRRLYKTGSVQARTPIKKRTFGTTIIRTPEYRAWVSDIAKHINKGMTSVWRYQNGI